MEKLRAIIRAALRMLLCFLFVAAGRLHFVSPDGFAAIVPPYLPHPRALVAVSGFFEILGGIGVLFPQPVRRWAGWGLILLLIAVFPANVHMALHHIGIGHWNIPPLWLWLRLPLQALLIAWVWWCTADEKSK